MKDTLIRIAEAIARSGGRAYLVGGCVRDGLMGRPQKDYDIEVHGIGPDELRQVLVPFGTPMTYGSSFGIISLPGQDIDIALPRKEKANSAGGHRGFDIDIDPHIGTKEAARRRDFTVNALMQDILTGEILDHFGGLSDLQNGILRHVDPDSFPEDPLRVFRAAQFASRLSFSVAPETVELCRAIDTSSLSAERVEAELKKALIDGTCPSVFFTVLQQMDQLAPWFTEIDSMQYVEQDPLFHPEGNVFIHSMQVLDRASLFRKRVSDPYAFMLSALTHDIGKIVSTEVINGRIHAYGHEVLGLPLLNQFLDRLVSKNAVRQYVLNMVPLHMKPNVASFNKVSVKSTNHMFDEAAEPEDLIYLALSDRPVIAGDTPFSGDSAFLMDRLEKYRETMKQPFVTGKDLLDAGLTPGKEFSELLAFSHKLRLAGIDRDSSLKQTLAYARKLQKNNGKQL